MIPATTGVMIHGTTMYLKIATHLYSEQTSMT